MQEINQADIVVTVKNLQSFGNRVVYAAIEDDSARERLVHLAGGLGHIFVKVFREETCRFATVLQRMPLLLDRKLSPQVQSVN